MPRALKPAVIDTIAELSEVKVLPGLKHGAAVFNLDTPDEVPCERCGALSLGSAEKCPSCGTRFSDEAQNARANHALKQKLAAGERAHREQAAKSRTVDPSLASSVVGGLGLIMLTAQQLRDAAAAEVVASKERLEKAQAALFVNDCAETRDDFQRAQLQAMAAPGNLALAEAALNQLAGLQPMAEECDAVRAAGSTPEDFHKVLAAPMQIARQHLDAAVAEFMVAFKLQEEHEKAGKTAAAKRKKLNEKLLAIRRTFDLTSRLPYGFGRMAGWDVVSHAAAQAVVDAIEKSPLGGALAGDLRDRIKSQPVSK